MTQGGAAGPHQGVRVAEAGAQRRRAKAVVMIHGLARAGAQTGIGTICSFFDGVCKAAWSHRWCSTG